MIRIHRAWLAGALSLVVVVGTACSATTAIGSGGGTRVATRQRPAADAVPTTTVAGQPAGPTTALPNLPTAPTVAPPPTVPPPTAAPSTVPAAPITYVPVEDDYGMLTVEVPATWTEIDTRPFVSDDGRLRPGISASTDLAAFDEQWDTPGLVFTAYPFQPDPNILFADYDYSNSCSDGGTLPYNDQVFIGYVRTYIDCDDVRSQNSVIVANAPGNFVTIVLVVQTVTPAEQAVYQHVLETFNVDPNVSLPTETVPPDTTAPLPTTPLPTTPVPTAPLPTAPVPTVAAPTVPVPTVPTPTSPALPTSPLLTTPVTAPVPTVPVPTAAVPTVPVPTAPVPTAVAPTVPGPTTPGTGTTAGVPAGYQEVTDDTGRLSVQVPATWIDTDGASAFEEGVEVAALSAAPNLVTFRETFDGPGLLIHETLFNADPAAELASRGLTGSCTPGPVSPNPNPAFAGVYQSWLDCGGTTADLHVLVANPLDGRQTTVVIVVQTLTPADEEALKVALSSYRLNTTV